MNRVLHEEYYRRLEDVLHRLRKDASARAVILIDKDGQQIADAGEVELFDPALKGFESETWGHRIGAWRFVYEIDEEEKIVFLTAASHRSSAYRADGQR